MAIYFNIESTHESCFINTAIFYLKDGGTITIDREWTDFSQKDGCMRWKSCYLHAINNEYITYPLYVEEGLSELINSAVKVEFDIDMEAEPHYEVIAHDWQSVL